VRPGPGSVPGVRPRVRRREIEVCPRFFGAILADDLSGAADCAASFTGAAGPIALLLRGDGRGEVQFALDADTRALDATHAAKRWQELGIASAGDRDSMVFKKIDSTLRGNIAPELRALLDEMPHVNMVVVAPAFPEQGRTVVNGRLYVRGEETSMSLAGIGDVIRTASDRPRSLILGDATEQSDLEGLVEGMGGPDAATLWVGSSGLARALAGIPPARIEVASLASRCSSSWAASRRSRKGRSRRSRAANPRRS
jgi:Uncharacterized protein conserved in bacteria